jgi:hypothetical protein
MVVRRSNPQRWKKQSFRFENRLGAPGNLSPNHRIRQHRKMVTVLLQRSERKDRHAIAVLF